MFVAQRRQQFTDFLDDGRLDAFRRLVEQEEPRQRHECASDRQYLLLTAQGAALALEQPRQSREKPKDALNRSLFGLA